MEARERRSAKNAREEGRRERREKPGQKLTSVFPLAGADISWCGFLVLGLVEAALSETRLH
jgi:hypothetical protein